MRPGAAIEDLVPVCRGGAGLLRGLLTAFGLMAAAAGCAPDTQVPEGAKISCQSDEDCPASLKCHAARCVALAAIDAVLPDVDGAVTVTVDPPSAAPGRPLGRSGSTFRFSFRVTEPLAELPKATLRFDSESAADCEALAALTYRCSYLATGSESGGRGGTYPLDLRLVDLAGNETSKPSVASVELDFEPPSVAAAVVLYGPGRDNPLAVVQRATIGTTIRIIAVPGEALDTSFVPSLTASAGSTTFSFKPAVVSPGSVTFEGVVPAGAESGLYSPRIEWRDLAGNQAATGFNDPKIVVRVDRPALAVHQELVTFVRSPWGNAASEVLGTAVIPAGPNAGLAPADPLVAGDIDPLAFSLVDQSGQIVPPELAPGNIALVRLWSDRLATQPLGSIHLSPDNTWPRARFAASSDAASVYVTGVDDAGNESSPPIKLERGEWIATANVPLGASPHRLESTSRAQGSLRPDPSHSWTAGGEASGADGLATSASAQLEWLPVRANLDGPMARASTAMTYDPLRGKLILFGGFYGDSAGGNHFLDDLWEWDSVTGLWEGPIVTSPRPIIDSAQPWKGSQVTFAFDTRRGKAVLYRARLDEVWEWDGAARSWSGPFKPSVTPGERELTSLVYDPQRQRTLLFGGFRYLGFRNFEYGDDLWEWDGKSWSGPVKPAVRPPGRYSAGLTYDSARGKVVLFGGSVSVQGTETAGDDLWEWDSLTSTWEGPFTPPSRPGPRWFARLAYDEARRRVVLASGKDSALIDELWEWDGASKIWAGPLAPARRPAPRDGVAVAYDSVRMQTAVFGGGSDYGVPRNATNELWSWSGSGWSGPVVPSPGATPRRDQAMAYDSSRGVFVVFGGRLIGTGWDDPAEPVLGDLLEYAPGPRVWSSPAALTAGPSSRFSASMVFDSARGRAVLFGGRRGKACSPTPDTAWPLSSELWTWDGAARTWEKSPVGAAPSPRAGHAAVWDDAHQKMIVFGGYRMTSSCAEAALDEVWEWDGTSWTGPLQPDPRPSARLDHAMAWDSKRGRAVLFGGTPGPLSATSFGMEDVWEWDASTRTWAGPYLPAVRPGPRKWHVFVYDPSIDRVVLFGGGTDEIWTWNIETHTWEGPIALQPQPEHSRTFAAAGYDSARGRILLYGGLDLGLWRVLDDVWELRSPVGAQPAIQFTADLKQSQIPWQSVTGLVVRADCGGVRDASTGAELVGFSQGGGAFGQGGWTSLGASAASSQGMADAQPLLPPPPGARLVYESASADDARRLLSATGLAAFQCRAAQATGAAGAKVAMDYVEVRVRYSCLPVGAGCQRAAECCSDLCASGACAAQ